MNIEHDYLVFYVILFLQYSGIEGYLNKSYFLNIPRIVLISLHSCA